MTKVWTPPDEGDKKLVDPEAESNHVDEQVEKVAVNVLKTAFRWVEQGRQALTYDNCFFFVCFLVHAFCELPC